MTHGIKAFDMSNSLDRFGENEVGFEGDCCYLVINSILGEVTNLRSPVSVLLDFIPMQTSNHCISK